MSVQATEVIEGYPVHPAASLFPMLDDDAMEALAQDIKTNGQLEPIWLLDGRILDGRNRLMACARAGVKPRFQEWSPSGAMTPTKAVIAWNLSRRHLTPSQRAALAVDIEAMFAEEIRRQRSQEAASGPAEDETSEAPGKTPGKPQALFSAPESPKRNNTPSTTRRAAKGPSANPFALTGDVSDSPSTQPAPVKPEPSVAGRARDHAAKVMHVSTGYVSHAKKVARESPELHSQVRAGDISLSEARRRLGETYAKPAEDKKVTLPKPVRRRRNSGRVTSSRISMVITATFGNPKIAEEILISMLEDPRVLDLDYEEFDDEG